MITLKQVIHFPDTNSVEATWVKTITLPQQELEEGVADLVLRTQEVVVRCHSYADVQMDMLRSDLGTDAAQFSDLIAKVEAGIKPAPPPDSSVLIARYEALLDQHLDAVAQKYRYADRTRLALRAGYPNEHQPLAVAFGTWMDQSCNRPAKQLMIDVIAGKKPMPSEAEFIAGLPPFVPQANTPL